ncbi:hypothetical protein M595_4671 [Lyngbya aestuarii BL J]|uniref:Uncharacterized protein n=1 Tax=Lyngbya aestuarii BL J TaxID=1348334 RepID=U7QED3_9CYAN|nr:hypothetical protein M595_4671 [Lyngbya aestuarii BL J]
MIYPHFPPYKAVSKSIGFAEPSKPMGRVINSLSQFTDAKPSEIDLINPIVPQSIVILFSG